MSYFWAAILPAFLSVSLLLAGHWAVRRSRGLSAYVGVGAAALALGLAVGFLAPKSQVFALGLFTAQIVLVVGFLAWQALEPRAEKWSRFSAKNDAKAMGFRAKSFRTADWFWHVVLIAMASMQWARSDASMAITSVRVLNTELITNLASIGLILALCSVAAWLLCVTVRWLPRLRWPLLAMAGILCLAPLTGNVLLSLMKLQIVGLTKARLSYAARTTNLDGEITYAALAIVLAFVLVASLTLVRKRRHDWLSTAETISSRVTLAAYRQARAVQAGLLAVVVVMACGQAYWDAVASQPPRLSEAKRVTLSEGDRVHLTLDPLLDGDLHRFVWVADDGKAVRFFVINRLPGKSAPAVVFDACLLCGDKGYIQKGDEVICIGCQVHLFRPSIGKPGGCNPVPIEGWTVDGTDILIPKESLEAGLPIFTTVLTIDVVDPVTGKTLTNTDARHRYAYEGKTYFFTEDWAYEAFREAPEKYVRGGGS